MGTNYADIILEKGMRLGVYTRPSKEHLGTDVRSSDFAKATLTIVEEFKSYLKETFGAPKQKAPWNKGGQKYVTIQAGDDECRIDINYWASTHKTIGSKKTIIHPYSLNVGIEGDCKGSKERLDEIIDNTLKNMTPI